MISRQSGRCCTGMPILSAYGYYFDPNNDRNRYVAMMDFCNWGSFDGGRSWAQYNTGNPFPHNVYVLLCDEKVPGLIWAGASQAHDLPCWKERANPKLGNAGLLTSRDGGRTWTALGPESGLPAGTVTGLVLDPESPPGRRTLFASLFGLGVFRSDDDGKTWRDSSNGIAPEHRRLFRLRRDSSGRLWTVSSMAMAAALYRRLAPTAQHVHCERLPSTSPAHAVRPDVKLTAWRSAASIASAAQPGEAGRRHRAASS